MGRIKSQLTMKIQLNIPEGLNGEQIAKDVYNIVRSKYSQDIYTQTFVEIADTLMFEEEEE